MVRQSRGDENYVGDAEGHPDAPANRETYPRMAGGEMQPVDPDMREHNDAAGDLLKHGREVLGGVAAIEAAQGAAAPPGYARRMREAIYHAVVALTTDQKDGGTRYPIPGGPGIPEQPTYAHSALRIEELVIEPLYEFARDETRTRDGFPDPMEEPT